MAGIPAAIPDDQILGESSATASPVGRSVWIVARPTSVASLLAPLSKGKYSISHWGILFSPHTKVDLNVIWMSKRSKSSAPPESWGTLIELKRSAENINAARVTTDFGLQHLQQEWAFSSITYIGQTQMDDNGLVNRAQEIVRDYPDYDVIWNNCQKFVFYLLETASPGCHLPTTLESMFVCLSTFFESSNEDVETPLPGAYPRSSHLRTIKTSAESTEYFSAIDLKDGNIDDLTSTDIHPTSELHTMQVGTSVKDLLALLEGNLPEIDEDDFGERIEQETLRICAFNEAIWGSDFHKSLPPNAWFLSAQIYECYICVLKYILLFDVAPTWVSPLYRLRGRGLLDKDTEDLLKDIEEDKTATIHSYFRAQVKNYLNDDRLEASVEPTLAELERLFTQCVGVAQLDATPKFDTIARRLTRWNFRGWKIRMGWQGGLQALSEYVAACLSFDKLLLDYQNILAEVLPSTFVFHRGKLPVQDPEEQVSPAADVAGIAVPPEDNSIDI